MLANHLLFFENKINDTLKSTNQETIDSKNIKKPSNKEKKKISNKKRLMIVGGLGLALGAGATKQILTSKLQNSLINLYKEKY